MQTELEACKQQLKDRNDELKRNVKRLFFNNQKAKEQCESKLREAEEQASESMNALKSELQACKRQMKERSQELQQEVTRLEGVVAAEKLSKEQCESEAAEQVWDTEVKSG